MDKPIFLSKSRFIKGLQCHKQLWLLTHRPELQDEVSNAQQAVFDAGTDVGILAQRLFPGGVEIPYDGLSISAQLARTQEEIAKGADTIYEAAFSFDGVFVKVDILHRGDDGWELYEVKGSTRLKEVYLNDIAVQLYVLAGAGITIARAALIHIDSDYVRQGDIDVRQLFGVMDVSAFVIELQSMVRQELATMRAMLPDGEPAIGIGPHCDDPYTCAFHGHCWRHIPSPSVFDFVDYGKPDAFALHEKGIVRMGDVPLETLNWRQQLQYEGELYQKNSIDTVAVNRFLDDLNYPLVFMDFETTCLTPVPLFDGTRPYQPVPFQFSLHWQEAPGGPLMHREFLAPAGGDPQQPFLEALVAALPESSCILTWNAGFEGRILRALAERFPAYRAWLEEVIDSLVDLMQPFKSKQIYHWQFDGSYSIKAVLPSLVPELSYDALAIGDGGTAADSWLRMRASDDPAERERIRADLLAYCHLDTLAMVRILERMRELVACGRF